MKQTIGMKWPAYAHAYIEGKYYFFWFNFNIPEELYKDMLSYLTINNKLNDYSRYEELENYAKIAINYSEVCNNNEKFFYLDEKENNYDYFNCILNNYYDNINRIDKALLNLRIFDPYAQERFINYCLNLPYQNEEIGKIKDFSLHYHSPDVYEYSEDYEWQIIYKSTDDICVSNVCAEINKTAIHDTIEMFNPLYPPYDDIIKALENNDVFSRIIE